MGYNKVDLEIDNAFKQFGNSNEAIISSTIASYLEELGYLAHKERVSINEAFCKLNFKGIRMKTEGYLNSIPIPEGHMFFTDENGLIHKRESLQESLDKKRAELERLKIDWLKIQQTTTKPQSIFDFLKDKYLPQWFKDFWWEILIGTVLILIGIILTKIF